MMAVLQRNLGCPATIRTLFKRVCIRAPVIEVANNRDVFCLGRKKHEVCRPEIVFCRVAIWATEIIRTNVKHPNYLPILSCYDPSLVAGNLHGAWERDKKADSVPWCKCVGPENFTSRKNPEGPDSKARNAEAEK